MNVVQATPNFEEQYIVPFSRFARHVFREFPGLYI